MSKGFTLIEIVIVIAIISILMTVTMKFGSGRINLLQRQTHKEEFVADYEKLYTQTLTSNYHDGIRFETMMIKLSAGAGQILYSFDEQDFQTNQINTNVMISGVQLDGDVIDEVQLSLKPYVLGCTITGPSIGSVLHFGLVVDEQKNYCFEIKKESCKLIEHKCSN